MFRQLVLGVALIGFLLGCNQQATKTPPKKEDGGINIKVPGVEVDVQKGKVKVDAPGVNVDVEKK